MPAILPARLKVQSAELALLAPEAEEFCRAYHVFLDHYADRTFRPGKVGNPAPLMRTYQAPQRVIRAVLHELAEFAVAERDKSLKLTDKLWSEPILEFRLLAASLLGLVSPEPDESILSRVNSWANPGTEDRLVEVLISSGLNRLRLESTDRYFEQIETWVQSGDDFESRLGLKAMPPLLEIQGFGDYPLIFRNLARVLRSDQKSMRPEVLAVIRELSKRSPKETAFFLAQAMSSGMDNSNTAWLIRHTKDLFPVEYQAGLREALRRRN